MYALALSLFVFWQERCVISNENLLIQTKTLVFRPNLEFRSKYQLFQIHNFEILGLSHIYLTSSEYFTCLFVWLDFFPLNKVQRPYAKSYMIRII